MLAAPTPTPTPVPTPTFTPTPKGTPYWQQISQAEYDRFRAPTGSIDWRPAKRCGREGGSLNPTIEDITPDGIKDRMEWASSRKKTPAPVHIIIKRISKESPNLFTDSKSNIQHVCATVEALHPRVPVVRTVVTLNASRPREPWWENPDTGEIHEIWRAYRIEARHIYTQGDDRPEFKQLGPVLIEPLGQICNRGDIRATCDIPDEVVGH